MWLQLGLSRWEGSPLTLHGCNFTSFNILPDLLALFQVLEVGFCVDFLGMKQRGDRVSHVGDAQKLSGHGPGQLALVIPA